MAFIFADRIQETTTTTGTGDITFAGATNGYRTFSSVLTTGDTLYYTIQHSSANEWEVGIGTFNASGKLARTLVITSSNSDSQVNFSSGSKFVFLTLSAAVFPISESNLGTNSVTSGKISDNSVISSKIANSSVTSGKIADGSVTSGKVATNAIVTSLLADGSVTSGKVATNAIVTSLLADGSVTSGKIADSSVTSGKIATNSIVTSLLTDGSVTSGKVATNAIGNSLLRQSSSYSVIGRSSSTSGNVADIQATTGGVFLGRRGTSLSFYSPLTSELTISGCYATRSGTLSVNNATWTEIDFDGESWDTDSYHSTVTNTTRFTMPFTGKYLFSCQLTLAYNASTTYLQMGLYKNGTTFIAQQQNPVQSTFGSVGRITSISLLNSGDYIEYRVFQATGSAVNVSGCIFSVYFLGT